MTNHSDPSPIVRAYGGATVGFECSDCKRIHVIPDDRSVFLYGGSARDWAHQNALECCGLWQCEKHGREFNRGLSCPDCQSEKRRAKEQGLFERAKKISIDEYIADGGAYLYRDGLPSEEFFPVDEVQDGNGLIPDWAFACDPNTVTESDCDLEDHVAEGILADHHEDAIDWVDMEKIKQASKLIFEACTDVKSYLPDESIVVILRAP